MTPMPLPPRTAGTVLTALADDPTERRPSEFPVRYVTLRASLPADLDHVGRIAVSVADGLLLLPITHGTISAGWEHVDLDAAVRIPTPAEGASCTPAFRHAQRALMTGLTNAVPAAAEEASAHG